MSNKEIELSEEELLKIEQELKSLEEKEKKSVTKGKLERDVTRISTGIPELDRALEGGVPKGSWIAITGEPGTGKSILCMHFAWAGLKAGDPVVYVTTEAEFRDIVRQARMFGMDFEQYRIHDISSAKELTETPNIVVIDIFGLLKIARQISESIPTDVETARKRRFAALDIQTLIAAIQEAYKILGVLKEGGKSPMRHVRLIIDSMSAFWADKPAMARKYSYELKIAAHRENVTTYLVSQYAMTTKSTFGFGLEHIADGVFHLWMDDVESSKEVVRYMIIKKMRMTNHARTAFKVEILPGKGFTLEPLK
ncbi:MAG: KaiC domain-containing protein [Ignisphaera sp.]|jgi:KaiC domain protein|nr:KaiC domain-containing protein [Ignisphaera sp.]MCC6055816.1 KaiC domain-containing protein [Desulfurococcaceae archaeon]